MEKDQFGRPTVPCMFCGEPTAMTGTKKCDGCWEVARRLDEFVRTEAGRKFVRQVLAGAEANS